ncbi:MAG: hypothetical protein FWB88_09220 [Defluviitaleaceae bacterium]|nr:hypothetical protein [Defluviitaleaceae bacterium]MCL2240674.1 hypothetical protein [Defluviitaleaceae bacterium]
MASRLLPEDTEIIWNANPVGKYRDFLYEAMGKEVVDSKGDFQKWLLPHYGKTLKELVNDMQNNYEAVNLTELLAQRRLNIVSENDKAFIIAFDNAINELGYDCANTIGSGYSWSPLMIIYGKTGTKSRPCIARIYINNEDISLRLFFTNINKHSAYIENAPEHIKAIFFGGHDCPCRPDCPHKGQKIYTIDDKTYHKCCHADFRIVTPKIEELSDYMGLLAKFYPVKKVKSVK